MTTGGVKVELSAGNVWTLRYNTPAFIKLEEVTGYTLGELQERMARGSVIAIVTTVWVGLLHAEPQLTYEAAAERMDMRQLGPIAEAVGKALELALGPADEEATDEGNASAPTG